MVEKNKIMPNECVVLTPKECVVLNEFIMHVVKTDVQKEGFILYRKAKELITQTTCVCMGGWEQSYSYDVDLKPLVKKYEKIFFEKYGKDYRGVDVVAKKHLALIYIIESYKKCPDYFPIKYLYPFVFHMHYLKSKYRLVTIKQYERFLDEMMAYKTGSDEYKQIRYDIHYDDNTKKLGNKFSSMREYRFIGGYLCMLGGLYLSEYMYNKLEPLIKKLIELGDQLFFHDLVIQFYRRQHKLDEGIVFVEELKKSYLKKELSLKTPDIDKNHFRLAEYGVTPQEDPVIILFQIMVFELKKYKTKKPYKPHPMRKEEIAEELLIL